MARSEHKRLTDEAKVLKRLRVAKGLSMRQAASALGISDSTIAHIETGRMNPPSGSKLESMLNLYGPISLRAFKRRVSDFVEPMSEEERLVEMIHSANANQRTMIKKMIEVILDR